MHRACRNRNETLDGIRRDNPPVVASTLRHTFFITFRKAEREERKLQTAHVHRVSRRLCYDYRLTFMRANVLPISERSTDTKFVNFNQRNIIF